MAARAAVARVLTAARHTGARLWWPALLAAAVAVLVLSVPTLGRLNLLAYDLLAPGRPGTSDLVLVAIDEASLAKLGQWPWSRQLHARLVDRLAAAGAAGAAYAVLFSEPQGGTADAAASDAAFAAALARFGRMVLPVAPVQAGGGGVVELGPLPSFAAAAARLGHVDLEVDADGGVRRVFLRGGVGRELPALALALAETAHPGTAVDTPLPGRRRAAPRLAAAPGVWQRDNEVLLPLGRPDPAVWSFTDALEADGFADAVRGRAVLVGVTARGLGPEFSLVVAGGRGMVPGVQVHALVYDAWRANALIRPVPVLPGLLATLAVLGATLLLWPAGDTHRQQAVMAASVLAPLAAAWLLLRVPQLWWGPAPAVLGLLTAGAVLLAVRLNATARTARRARRDAKATLDSIGDAVFNLDRAQRISYLNGPARALAQLREPVGKTIAEAFAFDTDSAARLGDTVRGSLEARDVQRTAQPLLLHPAGRGARALSATVAPLLSERGGSDGVVIALGDLTDAVASARQLNHAATHDLLTGLPNRGLVQDRLQVGVARALRSGASLAVLFLDLDRFKRINDSLGHHVGDEVLRGTARRLRATCRANDTVGRWGGDEFVVVLEDVAERGTVAAVAAKIVQALLQPMRLDGVLVPCSCSIGIAIAPGDSGDPDELLAMADAAMYRAKSQSNTRFQFYANDLNRWTRERLTLELELREALQRGEFELHYQPQVNLATGRAIAFEALLRWRRADGRLVLPADFIPVAEECGLIIALGEWVIQTAAEQLVRWAAQGLAVLPVAVNVSARQCMDRRLVDSVRDVLAATAIDPALLRLEITESTAMADAAHATLLFDELAALGLEISVDDFGTGYSSLSRLRCFPIHELKIDRSFVQHMTTDADDAAIVLATIALAHGMGLRVVAEGVETQQQHAFLALHACDAAQGWLHGRPATAQQIESLLEPLGAAASTLRP